MAERLRKAIAGKGIETSESVLRITASFGVTGIDADTPDSLVSPDAMVKTADGNLYCAKEEGHNTVRGQPL